MRLTGNDKFVFYSLVKWPHLNDTELSQNVNIKRSTITAIRNKLEKNKLYTTIKVPDLARIGCEILTVRYGGFNPLTSYESREKYSSTYKFPEVFFKRTTDKQRIALSAATNFTAVKKYIDYSNRVYGEHGFLTDEGITHAFFPFEVSKTFRFFDYAPLLKQHFNLDIKEEEKKVDTNFVETEKVDLTENEKNMFYAMIKHPELNDNELSKKVSMTRQSVSSARKRMEEEELIKTIRIPNLEALDFELLALTHILFNPETSLSSPLRKHGIQKILSQGAHIFYIAGNLDFVLISAFKDYPEYNRTSDEILSYYKEHNLLLKNPTTRIFVNKEIKLRIDGRFAPLIKKIFNIKKEI